MRMAVGVAFEGRVIEMLLPASVPLAHLVPEVMAAVGAAKGSLDLRSVGGARFDLEQSLVQQDVAAGSVICLEERGGSQASASHDPAAAIADRGPPVELVSERAAYGVIGGMAGAWIATGSRTAAAVVVACAPMAWALLPFLGGLADVRTRTQVQRFLLAAAVAASGAALAASGPVAASGPAGLGLDACLAATVLVHAARGASGNALLRVILGAAEWWFVGAVLPLMVVVAGWSSW